MTLKPDEFIRRFLSHILPKGFTRVRAAGFLAGCVRQKNLDLIHRLLGLTYESHPAKSMTAAELLKYFYGRDVTKCQNCHAEVQIYHRVCAVPAANRIRAA